MVSGLDFGLDMWHDPDLDLKLWPWPVKVTICPDRHSLPTDAGYLGLSSGISSQFTFEMFAVAKIAKNSLKTFFRRGEG